MNQDDPEKRIGDLERQLGEQRGADLPPAQPPQEANVAPGTGSGSRKPGFWAQIVRVLAIFCVGGGLYFLAVGCLNYTNLLRTPRTAATIDYCDNETTCYGRWSVGGVAQTGRIYGDLHGDHPVGSQVDVLVWRGRAYAGHPSQAWFILLMAGSAVAIATGVVLWWSLRRKYKSR